MEGEAIDERAAAARRGGSRRRLGKRHRQLHGLGLGVGERIGLVVDRIAVATREQEADLAAPGDSYTICAPRSLRGAGGVRHV
jgi:hypothetical protein